jgi:hypothetical protein
MMIELNLVELINGTDTIVSEDLSKTFRRVILRSSPRTSAPASMDTSDARPASRWIATVRPAADADDPQTKTDLGAASQAARSI